MTGSVKSLSSDTGKLRHHTMSVLRPSVEALLLAAVALGVSQAGWSLLTPGNAGASSATSSDDADLVRISAADIRSPFAPNADNPGQAVSALLSSLELTGVRIADDPAASGAYFVVEDGAQRAFAIGQEIAEGVSLAEIDPEYVLLTYDGGQHRLDMTAGPTFSFARAMMGLEQAPGAPAAQAQQSAGPSYARAMLGLSDSPADAAVTTELAENAANEAVSRAAASEAADAAQALEVSPFATASLETTERTPAFSIQDRAWLTSALANVETADGQARGWRIEAPSAAARAAGLRAGDLVVSVNGAGPSELPQVLAAAQAGDLDLLIERDEARINLTIELGQRT